ncbi:RDD family protein [Microbacterium sp. C7(2022)]|uniref:RDD family protein n=1 Tax=Microbacterium sp. C7(2022) TaxID=2992759 RepID=UPI00237AE3C5|nr:RDD family protein [Microbacterium sp. C7(2022)]MDE0547310.1 RDD family protein [Microbacterium sp. C7(2022)]
MPGAETTITHVHQDEILTGEAVALDVQPLGFFMRALGVIIDMLASIIVILAFVLATTWLGTLGLIGADVIPIVTIVIAVLVMVVAPTTIETATRGRSLGRLAVGGRIVRVDGGAAGFRHAFIRALVGVLELWFTFGAIAALVGAFTPRSQRLGDLLAGTYSERTRTPALPPAPSGVPAPLVHWANVADVGRLPDRLSRRIAQFTRSADKLEAPARSRLATSLAHEASEFVSPVPDADPETFLRAVAAVRRAREIRAIELENARVASLVGAATTPHSDSVPHRPPQ